MIIYLQLIRVTLYKREIEMNNTKANEALRELTMMLIYLSRFTEKDRFHNSEDCFAWKGYNFDILNELNEADYIRQGRHPARSKSVYITDSGIAKAKELLKKYGIDDWR